jgi:signal transduction histidine kinase
MNEQWTLKVERDSLLAIFAAAPVGMLLLDKHLRIIQSNYVVHTWVLRNPSQLFGQPVGGGLGCIHSLDDARGCGFGPACMNCKFHGYLRQVLETGRPVRRAEIQLQLFGGWLQTVWLRINAEPLLLNGQKHVVMAMEDITGLKRKEKEPAAKKQPLELHNQQLHKSESLGRMAGAIAHHFNNQLQAVMIALDMASNNMPPEMPGAEAIEHINEAKQAANNLTKLSSAMLTYLGQIQAKIECLDLSAVCRQPLDWLRLFIPTNVTLETNLPVPGPVVQGGADQLKQVLTNLITNAAEAMGGVPGKIQVAVKTVSAMDIPATNRSPIDFQPQDQTYACLEVADTGCGIPAENIENLFDPFYSSKLTSRGLGLSVVLGVVRKHHGAITVTSQVGQGTVFKVLLPLAVEINSQAQPA